MSTQNRMETPVWPRFLKYVLKLENGCWLWTGAIRGNGRNEYGAFWVNGRTQTQRAHIVSYVWTYGEPDCDLHHTCENSMCVNPEHLVPASAGQPRHRNPIPGLCAHDHEFTPENTYVDPKTGWRQCRACRDRNARESQDRNRDKINARRRERREHITYDIRPCQCCGLDYQPKRSDSRYCTRQACINLRQNENRAKRQCRLP